MEAMRVSDSFISVRHTALLLTLGLSVILLAGGCSIKRMALNKVGNALSQSTGGTFASDNDPELIGDALPFSLKLMESILAETPQHVPLLVALSRGFTSYSFAYLQMEADYIEEADLQAARAMRERARNLYLRARNYGLQGLEASRPGFTNLFFSSPELALATLKPSKEENRNLVQWTLSPWAAAISLSKDRPDMIAELPHVESMIEWMLRWEGYAQEPVLDSLLMSFESVRTQLPPGAGTLEERIRRDFEGALRQGNGLLAGPYVTLAEAVSIQNQDVEEFKSLLGSALAIDVDLYPEARLENLLMQKRARWLLEQVDELFLPELPPEE
jgi:predicted anti-sigma-YlaC factor YlaD